MKQHSAPLAELKGLLHGHICVLGIGNRYRRDDGAGSLLTEALTDAACCDVIDAGTVPENYLEKVARTAPDTILVIDAADFGAVPGGIGILDPRRIATAGLSTHALSLSMLLEFLTARTSARVIVLAIQPVHVREGRVLSKPVSETIEWLRSALPALLNNTADSKQSGRQKRHA